MMSFVFGIDFVFDREKKLIYPIELNPRLLGTTQMYMTLQNESNEPSLIGFHILEFLNAEYKINIDELNNRIKKEKKGAHIILRNKYNKDISIKKTLRPGVYTFKDNELVFLRSGYCLRHIKDKRKELVITSVPQKRKVFEPNSQLIRIHTYNKVLKKDGKFLSDKFKAVCEKIYDCIACNKSVENILSRIV